MKRFLKFIGLSAGIVVVGSFLLLTIAAVYIATSDDADWKQLAVRLVRAATGHELEIDGELALTFSWHPSLTVTDFSVTGPADASSFTIPHVKRLELTLDLPRLRQRVIHVERFELDGARIHLAGGGVRQPKPRQSRGRRPWVFLVSDARLSESRLVYSRSKGQRPIAVELDVLTVGNAPDSKLLEVAGRGSVNGHQATVSGGMGPIQEFFEPTGPYPVRLSAELRSAKVNLNGTVDRPASGTGLALDLAADAGEVADVLRLLYKDWPPMGALKARARLLGDLSRVQVEKVSLVVADDKGLKLQCTGNVADLNRQKGVDLRFEAEGLNTSWLRAVYGPDIPRLGGIRLSGRVHGDRGTLRIDDLDGRIDDRDLVAKVKGQVGRLQHSGTLSFEEMDLSIAAQTPDLSRWSTLAGHHLPPLGPTSLQSRARGRSGGVELTDLDLKVGPSEEAQVRVRGEIEKLTWQPRLSVAGVKLSLKGSADQISHLFVTHPDGIYVGQEAQASGELTDQDGSLGLEDVHLQVGTEASGFFLISGGIDDLEKLREADLSVEAHLPNLTVLSGLLKQANLLKQELPPIGPVNGTLEIRDSGGTFGAEKIDVRIGSRQDTWIGLSGKVGDLVARKDIDLSLDVSAQSLAAVGPFIQRELPPIGPVTASGRLLDQNGAILVEGLSVNLGAPGEDHIQASGQVRDLAKLEGLEVDLDVSLRDLSLFEALAGRQLPKAGPVTGTLEIVSNDGTASARKIALHVGNPKTVWLNLQGQVGDVAELKEVELVADAGTAALPLLEPLIGRKMPDIGPVRASARLEDKHGTLGVQGFRAESETPGEFKLEATGAFDDIRALDGFDLDLRVQAKDLSRLATVYGVRLPKGSPVALETHLTGSDERVQLEQLDLSVGRTKIHGKGSYTTDGVKPEIQAQLTSPLVYASDLYLQEGVPEPGAAAVASPTGEAKQGPGDRPRPSDWLFSDQPLPLDWLRAYNLNFSIDVDELDVETVRFDAAKWDLKLEDGVLHLHVFEDLVDGGSLRGSLVIDNGGEIPTYSANLDVKGWESGALAAQFVEHRYIEGETDGKLSLEARGISLREIMASLDGEIVAVLGGGKLRGIALDLLAANLFKQLLVSEDPRTIPLNCAVEDLEIKNGLATARTILVDTDETTITGSGTIDLRTERIDIMLDPRPKRPRLATLKAPVSIRGDLGDPKVKVESTRSFFETAAKALGLGLINPFAAVIPFISTGSFHHHPCAKFLEPTKEPVPPAPGPK